MKLKLLFDVCFIPSLIDIWGRKKRERGEREVLGKGRSELPFRIQIIESNLQTEFPV